MMKKLVPFVLISFFISGDLLAATNAFGLDVEGIMNNAFTAPQWGGTSTVTFQFCKVHALEGTESCIGASAKQNCKSKGINARYFTDEYATQMMVARKITDTGAFFCPTQIEGRNEDKGDTWIAFGDLVGGDSSRCTWLCKEGYTGVECKNTEANNDDCDISLLKRENFSSIKRLASGPSVSVPEFGSSKPDCGVNKTQEHKMILAVTKWTTSGHGAFVRQMMVRAERTGWDDMVSWASVYPAGNSGEVLVCKNGYKPNATKTDCVAIDSNICNAQQLCDGWDGFDENIHRFYVPTMSASLSTGNLTVGTKSPAQKTLCYQYRCLEAGTAFVSSSNRSCAPCVNDARDGVSPADGTCIKCGLGQIFDENALSSGYCATADAYSKTDMMYGKGKTKSNVPNIKNQCWTMVDLQDYLNCVKGILTGGNILQVDSQRRTTSASQELLNNLSNVNLLNKQ